MKIDKIKEVKKIYSQIHKQKTRNQKSPFFTKVMNKLAEDRKIKP